MKNRLLITLLLLNNLCLAQTQPDPEWPCVQVLVPEISAAAIWDGPTISESPDTERYRQASSELVFSVVEQHNPLTESQLDAYLGQINEEQHNEALTFLFHMFLQTLNQKRGELINSIKRYTRSQIKSAKQIETLLDQKAELENQPDSVQQLEEINSQLHWQRRMFKQREQSIVHFCELPRDIEQQAGELARMISARLIY